MQKLTNELEIQKDAQKVPDIVVSNNLGQKKVIFDETIRLELQYFHFINFKFIDCCLNILLLLILSTSGFQDAAIDLTAGLDTDAEI